MTEPEKRSVRVSAGEMSYVDAGDPETPAVVFLHGFPTSSYLWRELVPMVSPWMRAIAPDLLGAGDSAKPADLPLHPRAQAGYVRELLAELGIERFAVVAHAAGGAVAQLLALGGAKVEAMVLIDSVAFDSWPSDPVRELQTMEGDERLALATLRSALELGFGHPERLTDEIVEAYARPFRGDEGAAAYFRWARALDGIGLTQREDEFARLEIPALLLWGEDDPFQPVPVAERLADLMPRATLAVLPGCSHFLTEDAPETVVPLVFQYLRSVYLGETHAHGGGGPVVVELGLRPREEDG